MLLSTVGHATLSLKDDACAAPTLITDPWVLGSCYWRSWWLERYPSPDQVTDLARARFCYLTHEHPDHFHPPSLRRLGKAPCFLVPEFSRDMMGRYLRQRDCRARTVTAGMWYALSDDVRILSMPTLGNDSALLIDTPDALIANLSDARPTPDQLLALRWLRRSVGTRKPCILLASYSAAGIGNSMHKHGKRLAFASGGRHVRYVKGLYRALDAQMYVPFASQVSFERPDTRWANQFRVSYEELLARLRGTSVQVLPPYVTLDLRTGKFVSEYTTPAAREPAIEDRVETQLASEVQSLNGADIEALGNKLRAAGRGWLPLLCPRGVGFVLPQQRLAYQPLSGRIGEMTRPCSITFRLPAQAIKDTLASGYLSDLCIPMFTHVDLAPEVPPHYVYALFVLLQLHDVGAIGSWPEFKRWVALLLRERQSTISTGLGYARLSCVPVFDSPR